ncbi:segregation and condensation protein B [Andreesenia angusta]|uniref:Segregation and condensation protein B n=1 Tax=Andreesenia angusta TaxID=39480 RepID=A0A1S1VAV6_9FIRM|nr:SMC-Scp complex subunit ScpB [Andreesenia angusta]OHW62969.1 segregation and condensation protein B [Andreesenia angusta]
MDIKEIKAVIEGLLFTWGEPLHIREIEKILETPRQELVKIIEEMRDEFNYNRRGIQIVRTEQSYQLSTRLEHFEYVKKLHNRKENKGISNAALETLTIVAYKQPITKTEIEDIRGVKCDKAVQTLADRQLIAEVGRLDKPGKPILYGTTDEFLRAFGLGSIKELPILESDENLEIQEEEGTD